MSRPSKYAIVAIAFFMLGMGLSLFFVFFVGFENPDKSYEWIPAFGLGLIVVSMCFGFVALFSSLQPKDTKKKL